uniref:Putative secreted protein n=1 Tax=Ixodes ricinus TaxID=34613 RepID=A0A147BP30_IXORI
MSTAPSVLSLLLLGGTQSKFFALPDCARQRPEFRPERWNMYDATIQDKDWTNNTFEGWNTGFQKLVGHAHPNVWRLVECLQLHEALVATALTQAWSG